MAERDLNSEFTGNVSIFSQTKPRQAVKVDPTDDAHMTTHQPPAKDQTRYGDDAGGDYAQNQAQFWARRTEDK